ncbi:hypothetical protein BX286_6376 [Streptomyces sp. 3211.6]|uniref:DUF6426 family protein n=1 Tax=Streptomyces TaxID=1883 RepID=UPI0009A4CD28|nr:MULTISPECIES: DUF6426 family protein [Streptomyces]RKT08284.1 hypothetical protein BX286_6376 [Streptomyces sp. 3211.6]RPF29684.1 hypothetical protein EDD96_6221 [Streptomyces sp. Ag109_G2-6]
MNLRKFVVAAALGATVLTAVPALVAPHPAAADGCWGEYYSDCQWDPGAGYDPGGSGGGDYGGGDYGGGGGGEVVIIPGSKESEPAEPAYPGDPSYSYESDSSGASGGGSSGGADSAVPFREGEKAKLRLPCKRNDGPAPMKWNESSKYTVSYKVSGNISATAAKLLTVSVGGELNSTTEKSIGFEITLNPGQGFALDVEYQTKEYMITTTNWLGQTTVEFANVTAPTGAITAVPC